MPGRAAAAILEAIRRNSVGHGWTQRIMRISTASVALLQRLQTRSRGAEKPDDIANVPPSTLTTSPLIASAS